MAASGNAGHHHAGEGIVEEVGEGLCGGGSREQRRGGAGGGEGRRLSRGGGGGGGLRAVVLGARHGVLHARAQLDEERRVGLGFALGVRGQLLHPAMLAVYFSIYFILNIIYLFLFFEWEEEW
jgi:hypothetical protein